MSAFWDRRIKTKKDHIIIERLAYFFLFIFSISIFYLLWLTFKNNNYVGAKFLVILYVIFLLSCILVIRDIRDNYEFFRKTKNKEGIIYLEDIHYVCANPMCPRCGGWYLGLLTSLGIILGKTDSIIRILNHKVSPYHIITIGIILFGLSTPLHGVANFLNYHSLKIYDDKLKFILGLISGLSLSFIVIGIIIIYM